MTKHRNDIYGDIEKDKADQDPLPAAIPAATVLLLRESAGELEVLMLHKNSKISFGGLWVFPGGKIDEEDYPQDRDPDEAARNAAARETAEEAGISIEADKFVWFAHWTPPMSTAKRFATWFFVTLSEADHDIQIDGGEIQNHQWISPTAALQQHTAGDIDLAPPTWVSLYHLSKFDSVDTAIASFEDLQPRYYQTRVVKNDDGIRVCLWLGDEGYDDWNADLNGATHRLSMLQGGFHFEHSAVDY
jgi:8-oxo-dGTP pyrophosphatase MutT (NUDIX family)